MSARDDRIEALRLEIIEAQKPLLDAWSLPKKELHALAEAVAARVKKLRAKYNEEIRDREAARAVGSE